MDLGKFKYILIPLLVIAFFISFFTGLLKFPGFLEVVGINYTSVPSYDINLVHDWGGIILVVLILIHIFLNWKWFANFLSLPVRIGGRLKVWHLFILLLALMVLYLFHIQGFFLDSRAKELASREIRDYQGENLSSINDLEETFISGIQYINKADYLLEISGLVEEPKEYTYDQVLSFDKYSKVVELNCVVGWSAKILWEGFLLKDVLDTAKVKPEAKIAIFYAKDGFTTSLPLDYIYDNDIILAYKINDVVLPPEKGFPFQLVAEQKWGYKWVKWITKIELSDNIDYLGTYEKAGYNNDADITGPKREI